MNVLKEIDGVRIYQGIERSKLSFRPSTLNKYTVFALIWTLSADESSRCGEAGVEQEDSPDWKPQSPKEMGLALMNIMNQEPVLGAQLFFAKEDSSLMSRIFLDKMRNADFHVYDQNGLCFTVHRPFRIIEEKVQVFSRNNELLGTIKKHFSLHLAKIQLYDKNQEKLYWIKGPKIPGIYCWRQLKIGCEKKTLGFLKRRSPSAFSVEYNEDIFDIFFPPESSADARVLLLAATLFIDLLWFETSQLWKG